MPDIDVRELIFPNLFDGRLGYKALLSLVSRGTSDGGHVVPTVGHRCTHGGFIITSTKFPILVDNVVHRH